MTPEEKKNAAIVEAGKNTRFGAPGVPTNKGGRKKKIRNILTGEGFAASDIREAAIILGFKDEAGLRKIAGDDGGSVIVRILSSALLDCLSKGSRRLSTVKELLEIASGGKIAEGDDGGSVEIIIRREAPPGQ